MKTVWLACGHVKVIAKIEPAWRGFQMVCTEAVDKQAKLKWEIT